MFPIETAISLLENPMEQKHLIHHSKFFEKDYFNGRVERQKATYLLSQVL